VLSHRTFYFNDYSSWGYADSAETYVTVLAAHKKLFVVIPVPRVSFSIKL